MSRPAVPPADVPVRGTAGRAAGLLRDVLLGASGGVLFALPSVSDAFVVTPYVGLVPWIYLYGIRERRASLFAFLVGICIFWIAFHRFLFGYSPWVPVPTSLIFIGAYLLFPVFLRAARRLTLPWTIVAPVAWVATEYVQSRLAVSGVSTILVGYSQARLLSLVQIADLGGVLAVSGLVALVNGFIADVFVLRARGRTGFEWRRLRRLAGATVAVLLLANLYGFWRLATLEVEAGPRVGIVQPGVSHSGLNVYSAFAPTVSMTAQAWPETYGAVDLIVWPENAIQAHYEPNSVFVDDIGWLAARVDAPILAGFFGRHPERPAASTNSIHLIGPDGESHGRYDKIRLLAFAEYLPFEEEMGLLQRDLPKRYSRAIAGIVGYATAGEAAFAGDTVSVFRYGDLPPFSALICFETVSPDLAREAVRGGARFLVNPTSEGRVGAPTQLQMLRISAFRAIETRMPVVRAGNEGISAVIGPDGSMLHVLKGIWSGNPIQEPGVLTAQVPLAKRSGSVYASIGDVLGISMLLLSIGGGLWAFVRR